MKKSIAIVPAALFALALFASCTRTGYNYYPGQFVPQNISYNPGQFVAQDINYNSGQFVAVNNNYNPGPSAAQAHSYYFGPYVSVVTGTLTSKTIITTEGRGNSAVCIYMLNTANPINISKVNIPDDSDVITANNVAAFELAVCSMNLSAYLGSQVRVTGQFSLRDYGNDSTRTVMDVNKLEIYNTAPVSQGYAWGYELGNVQGKAQGSTQGGTQINTQINAQGNAQVNAQINIQSNTQNSTQSITQSAGKKQPTKKTAPASAATKPKPKTKTYRIQVGAFCDPANAQKVVARLQCQNLNPVKEKYLQYTRVVLKGIPANKVESTLAAARRAGFCDFWKQLE